MGEFVTLNKVATLCRPGFEAEAIADFQAIALSRQMTGFGKAKKDSGLVIYECHEGPGAEDFIRGLRLRDMIFGRELFCCLGLVGELPAEDRITPLLDFLETHVAHMMPTKQCSEVWVEACDTNEGRALLPFCSSFSKPLSTAIKAKGWKTTGEIYEHPRIHILFLSYTAAYVGMSYPGQCPPWPMGLPRLKLPRESPSRSTLKLEEAFLTLMSEKDRASLLRPGLTAVDLGASPGGWTYHLVKLGMHVTAIDNGDMDPALMESGLVGHRREDGFRFTPRKPVEWLVCDMVEKPRRIAKLVGEWLTEGRCRAAVFNLKLPMKKRYEEVDSCLEDLRNTLAEASKNYKLRCRQLYHDREEVTVCVVLK